MGFYRFSTFLRTKKTWMPSYLRVQFLASLWGHENELSTKFWGSLKAYFCCSSFISVFSYFVPAKTRLGRPPKKHMKKNMKFFWTCILTVVTLSKRLHKKQISNSPSKKNFPMSKSYISLSLHLYSTSTLKVLPVKVEQDHAQ